MQRGKFIQANISGKIETGFVVYTRGKKVICWFFNVKSDEPRTVYVLDKQFVREIERKDIPDCDFLKSVDSLMFNKGDFVDAIIDGKKVTGRLTASDACGYSILSKRDQYEVDFQCDIKLTPKEDLIFDENCPLSDWDATIRFSKITHHDGGYCKEIVISHKGKKAFVCAEDEYSHYELIDGKAKINGLVASQAFIEASKAACIASGVKESYMFFAESPECIGEFMLFHRGHETLAKHYNKM